MKRLRTTLIVQIYCAYESQTKYPEYDCALRFMEYALSLIEHVQLGHSIENILPRSGCLLVSLSLHLAACTSDPFPS